MTEVLPEVLLNPLRQYSFDGSPLWRMADGKDHVQIQVTFRKSTDQPDKKRAGSRRQPTPSTGKHQRDSSQRNQRLSTKRHHHQEKKLWQFQSLPL